MDETMTTFKIVYTNSMVEPYYVRRYKGRKCAQNAADKLNAKHGPDTFAVYSLEEYEEAVKGKGEWKTSVCGGQKVWVPLGTPASCDPSTETYWSL